MKMLSARITGFIIAGFIRLVKRTSHIVYEPGNLQDQFRTHRPFILAMWHGQFMMLAGLKAPEFKVAAMVSRHADGELVAVTLGRFGIVPIRGAGAGRRKRDRGGASALRQALRALKGGTIAAMTADVPLLEARSAGHGIVTLARLSGRPIIPIAAATSRSITLKTWSKMTINLPFSRLAFVGGPALFVPANATTQELEQVRREVEQSLDAVTARAHELVSQGAARVVRTNRRSPPHRYR